MRLHIFTRKAFFIHAFASFSSKPNLGTVNSFTVLAETQVADAVLSALALTL
jgi:hypothetical protein